MFVVSFRIPFRGFRGEVVYHNGAAPSMSKQYQKGEIIQVRHSEELGPLPYLAEVIDTQRTRRQADSFGWSIVENNT